MKHPKLYNTPIPEENRVVTCPHCKQAQNECGIPIRYFTSDHWEAYNCDHCGRLFAYAQIVTRSYVTATVQEMVGIKDRRNANA